MCYPQLNDRSLSLMNFNMGDKEFKSCFFSLNIATDTPFYDKQCVEDGNFAWTNYQLGYTIFINPAELFEKKVINGDLFNFV